MARATDQRRAILCQAHGQGAAKGGAPGDDMVMLGQGFLALAERDSG